MRPLVLDKIASVTLNCDLRRDVRIADEYPCREGDVIAVRVKTTKSVYNSLELATGRISAINQGDVIAGALGHRNALQGYAGVIPKTLKRGDCINLLNLGGVLGVSTSYSPLVGSPHECEVLGAVLSFPVLGSRKGIPCNIANGVAPLDESMCQTSIPIIAVAGTSMNSGKTEACLSIIQQFVRRGLRVAAAKTTGVSLRRDILGMQDAGATEVLIFTDFGVVTTQPSNAAELTKTMINRLVATEPDVILLELGDGLVGDYGVAAILGDPEIAKSLTAVVLAAADPVGAWGGTRLLIDRHQITPALITGPTTDNIAGISVVERETSVTGLNARHSSEAIADLLSQKVLSHAK